MSKNIVLFRYSPSTMMINYANLEDTIVITPDYNEEKYTVFTKEWGFQVPTVIYLKNFTLKNIFLEIKKISEENVINQILTLSEEDIEIAGLLNTFFTEKNKKLLSSFLFKDKYYMRCFLQDSVNQPQFEILESEESLNQFVEATHSEKFIIKARSKAGAEDVFVYDTKVGLPNIEKKYLFSGEFLIETYVSLNNMLTFDGYSYGENIIRYFVHEYDQLILTTLQNKTQNVLRTSRLYNNRLDLIELAYENSKKVLETFGDNSEIIPFHFEWFYSSETNDFVFCEVGKRFGGGNIPTLIENSFEVPVLKEYWELNDGENIDMSLIKHFSEGLVLPKRISTYYSPFKKNGYLMEVPNEDPDWAMKFWKFSKANEMITNSANISEVHYIIVFSSENELEYSENLLKLSEYNKGFKYKK